MCVYFYYLDYRIRPGDPKGVKGIMEPTCYHHQFSWERQSTPLLDLPLFPRLCFGNLSPGEMPLCLASCRVPTTMAPELLS